MNRPRPSTAPRRRNSARGFTLIELSLVTALLGVLMALAWPEFRSLRKNYLLETTAHDLVDCMAFARASAVGERAWYKLVLTQNPALYTLYRMDVSGGASSGPEPAPGRWGAGRTVAPDIEIQAPNDPILFFPNGTATAATVVLKEDGFPPLSIQLSGALGYATIAP
jgi:prepilin-type N-terminal cleavage/methylation domain-containing protein